MLKETTPPIASAEVLAELARHLRLAPDFAADQEADLRDVFEASVAHLEATLGLCLSPRGFAARVQFDRDGRAAAPMAPVVSLVEARRPDRDEVIAPDVFSLNHSGHRTVIEAPSLKDVEVDVSFEAGFGDDWSATPADLRRAVKMLAAHQYDQRHAVGGDSRSAVYGVASLIQPWREMRLTLGARA